ncbi:MAG: hypothetical protein SVT52_06615, partial [Planctomycetota bacterium]|nr:hypothetical protein [Planctomycetota bacterium]
MSNVRPKVLLLTGGPYHDGRESIQLIQGTLDERFNVVQTENVSDLAKLAAGDFQAVVIYTTIRDGELTGSLANTLAAFIENGG